MIIRPYLLAGYVSLFAVVAHVASSAINGLDEAPLKLPTSAAGPTRFTAMPETSTGLRAANNFADPAMWTTRYQEIVYGAMGTGVAVGDFDGDGKPDVLVVSKTEQSRLFRNLGGWKFADVTEKAGIVESGKPAAWTQGAAFADVNNDGRLDLYLCRFNAPNLLFINQGDGTFKEEGQARGLAVVDASVMGAFCDFDRDGWLDVYVQTNLLDAAKAPSGQKDYLYRNRGDGTFEDVTERAGIAGETMGHSATWWDYDADGWPDLYVANDYASPDALYRNNHDGTFTNRIKEAVGRTPYYSMGSDLGDVDNDGYTDLLVADMASTTPAKDQRGMAGSRARAQLDEEDATAASALMRNALFLGTGLSVLREGAIQAGVEATDWTWSVRFEDFDNDGRLDLHVTNGMIREYHNADLLEDIMVLGSTEASRRALRSSPVFNERNLAYRNEGGLKFREVGAEWGLDELGVSFGSATGDFDGDGDLDLIYGNYEKALTVLRNDSTEGHRLVVALRGTQSNRFGVGARVRIESALGKQVRTLVLARGYLSTSEPILHFGLGQDTTITKLTVEWPSGVVQTFVDLPVDRKLTITEPAIETRPAPTTSSTSTLFDRAELNRIAREQPEPPTNLQPLIPFRFDRRGPALVVLPRQDTEELLLGGTTKDPLPGFAPDVLDDGPLLVFEANGDGMPDLLQTKAGVSRRFGSDYQPKLHLGKADGFTPGVFASIPQSTGAVCTADFDRDGDLDVFLGARVLPGQYPLSPRSVLLRNDGGTFSEVPLPAGGELGLVASAIFSDLDRDGWMDLVVTTEWGTVQYLHNERGEGFSDHSAAQGFTETGMWTSIVSGDFNHDGEPDYAVGNLGLNTPYESGPAILYHGRFGDGGPPQILEALEYRGELYPRRPRNEVAPRVTGLLKRFPKQNDYAKATMSNIVGAERLAKARRFEARELRSGVYLSEPGGRHRFVPLPWEAQLAPIQGMVALDLPRSRAWPRNQPGDTAARGAGKSLRS
ncbi:MAG TPA: VCBS repeat-containing protein, partial [Opitutus sp.]|nr:VCBS repeat-containing protein [Opitutus sp.]